MMAGKNRLIHTPEGVRDSYNAECRKKLAVQDKILNTLYLYGYEHIQTPSFEYFEDEEPELPIFLKKSPKRLNLDD